MVDIFIKLVYVEKIYLTFGLKPTMRKLEKDNHLEMLDICIIFLQKIDSNWWYYLSIWPCLLIK